MCVCVCVCLQDFLLGTSVKHKKYLEIMVPLATVLPRHAHLSEKFPHFSFWKVATVVSLLLIFRSFCYSDFQILKGRWYSVVNPHILNCSNYQHFASHAFFPPPIFFFFCCSIFLTLFFKIYGQFTMLVSGVQHNNSVIHTYTYLYIYIFFRLFSLCILLQNIEYSSLSYIVSPCWLSILHVVVCIC